MGSRRGSSRRRRRAVPAGLALAGLLIGCQTNDAPPERPAPPAVSNEPSSPAEGSRRPPSQNSSEAWFRSACRLEPRIMRLMERGYHPGRSPDVVFLPAKPHFSGAFNATSHSGPYGYLQEVPLVFYGPGFVESLGPIEVGREVTVADIAPTFAELLGMAWPKERPGRALTEALLPADRRAGVPRLLVTVVWDGGGINVLEQWPRDWPELRRLASRGVSIEGALAGSSPSVTPAVHATIGTGAFPDQHGVVDIPLRLKGRIVGSYARLSPRALKLPTFADLYDRMLGNRPKVGLFADHNWHLGMIGHGAALDGADKDIAVVVRDRDGAPRTNRRFYKLPGTLDEVRGLDEAVAQVDRADGRADGLWLGHDLLGSVQDARRSPAWNIYQTSLIEKLLSDEGFGRDDVPDLFFTNYKQLDFAGHDFNMVNPEVKSSLAATDAQLDDLVSFLDDLVGRRRWAMVVTADHGQQPDALATNGWPMGIQELAEDVAAHFDVEVGELVVETRATGLWLDRSMMEAAGISAGEIADFLMDYRIGDNAQFEVPAPYASRLDERLMLAAFPGASTKDIARCAAARR